MRTLFNPLWFIKDYLSELHVEHCRFCIYRYDRRFMEMQRRFVCCPLESMERTAACLEGELATGEELAIDSRCIVGSGDVRHLAMLDWRGIHIDPLPTIGALAEKLPAEEYLVVWSGRSFHVYIKALLADEQFRQFLAEAILLENADGGVDYRWAAHRLMDGFATLRLTNHSRRHLYEPQVLLRASAVAIQPDSFPRPQRLIQRSFWRVMPSDERDEDTSESSLGNDGGPTLWDTVNS